MSMIPHVFAYAIFTDLKKKKPPTKINKLSEVRFPEDNNTVDHHPFGILF